MYKQYPNMASKILSFVKSKINSKIVYSYSNKVYRASYLEKSKNSTPGSVNKKNNKKRPSKKKKEFPYT